ncbi:MAG: hypothetical protein P1V36_10595 [Planctomycetota bacterium]|nr:hypothetical protein [Planctomycetota bacterium]
MPSKEPGTAPGLPLASAWADFTKSLSIYPDTNARVQGLLATMVEHIQQHLAARGTGYDSERGVTILFHDTTLLVDQAAVDIPAGSALSWLRERLAHGGLAGVEFMGHVEAPAIVGFTKQLLANFLRKESGLGFDDLWPDPHEGLVLIDLRFEGTFGGRKAAGPYRGGHAGSAVPLADTQHFMRGLLAHPKVRKRLTRLSNLTRDEDGETVGAGDMLARIMDDVPAEALESRDALITAVCPVMDALDGPAEVAPIGYSDGSGEAGSGEFTSLLYKVSREHFGRQGPSLQRLAPDAAVAGQRPPGGGRARDAAIEDDVNVLVDELAALPATLDYDFAAGEGECAGEQLAAVLHYLTHLEAPEKSAGLLSLTARLLASPGAAELALLREYLQAEDANPDASAPGREAIVHYLLLAGQAPLLRACGVLTPAFVVQDAPRRLPLLLAAIDTQNRQQLGELNQVCRALGTGILDHEADLRTALAGLDGAQAAAAVVRPTRDRLPLLRLLLAARPRQLVAEATAFLRALDLPEDEAFLLFQLHDPKFITTGYLTALIDLHLGRTDKDAVHAAIVDLLCAHVRATHTPLPEHPERLASIRSLGLYASAKSWILLKELKRTRFGPFGGHEPQSVRKLARSVLKRMGKMDSEDTPTPASGAPAAPAPDAEASEHAGSDDEHSQAA